jgi:hypothetical protein
MANLRYTEDYHTYFDPKTYLELFYKKFKVEDIKDGSAMPFVKAFHEFWSNFTASPDTEVRYLEFGGGPCIANVIFACPKVDHIVFAEYTEANRQAVKSWIDGDPEAHDWTALIEIAVLELEQGCGMGEGNNTKCPMALTENDKLDRVLNRANEVKQKIKSIISCDVTKSPIVQLDSDDVAKPFDVVSTSLCLEACVSSEVHYKNTVAELCKLLKPNGYLFMDGVLEQTFYFVGEEKFYTFPLTEKMVKEAMNEAGIEIEKFITIPINDTVVSDCKALFYTYGRKSVEK